MKISPKKLAQALYEITDGKAKHEAEVLLKKFAEVLVAQNMAGKVDAVIVEFSKIWDEQRGIIRASVTSARGLDQYMIKDLENYIIKIAGAKEVQMEENVDKNILGGVILKYRDKILDASLKAKLSSFKNAIIK